MLPRLLLTPSLYSSWFYWERREGSEKQEFLDVLLKKPREKTEAMTDGIKFEDDVHAACEGIWQTEETPYNDCVKSVARIVGNESLWQERVFKDIGFNDRRFLLYGKADAINASIIYDIKFSKTYDIGKYYRSIQHLAYMWCSNIPKFAYLISDGKSYWREDYIMQPDTELLLRGRLATMIDCIMAAKDFREAYEANWQTHDDPGNSWRQVRLWRPKSS